MFEKFLLAITITFSLNLFLGISAQSTQSTQVASQSTTTAQLADQPLYLAKALPKALRDRGFFRELPQ